MPNLVFPSVHLHCLYHCIGSVHSAPEVLAGGNVDEKVDMWALGVVMWVLLTGRHPFDDSSVSEGDVALRIVTDDPDFRVSGAVRICCLLLDLISGRHLQGV